MWLDKCIVIDGQKCVSVIKCLSGLEETWVHSPMAKKGRKKVPNPICQK